MQSRRGQEATKGQKLPAPAPTKPEQGQTHRHSWTPLEPKSEPSSAPSSHPKVPAWVAALPAQAPGQPGEELEQLEELEELEEPEERMRHLEPSGARILHAIMPVDDPTTTPTPLTRPNTLHPSTGCRSTKPLRTHHHATGGVGESLGKTFCYLSWRGTKVINLFLYAFYSWQFSKKCLRARTRDKCSTMQHHRAQLGCSQYPPPSRAWWVCGFDAFVMSAHGGGALKTSFVTELRSTALPTTNRIHRLLQNFKPVRSAGVAVFGCAPVSDPWRGFFFECSALPGKLLGTLSLLAFALDALCSF